MIKRQEVVTNLVSVIIPAYNAAGLIGETLQSLFHQSYPSIEIIVVDDGSTDHTAKLVSGFEQRVKLIRQPNSGGCSSPRNHGLRMAQGEFVTFFDADDLMLPAKLERQVDFLRRHPSSGAVLMDYRNFDHDGESLHSHFESCAQLLAQQQQSGGREFVLDAATATRILVTENFSIAGSPLIRRSLFDRIEAFDETLRASEDFDLTYRIARHSGLGIIAEVGFMRRLHDSNMSRRTAHILHYKIESRTKLMHQEPDTEARQLLAREIANYHLSMAEFSHRLEPRNSFRHVWSALRMGYPFNMRIIKGLAKCTLGALRSA